MVKDNLEMFKRVKQFIFNNLDYYLLSGTIETNNKVEYFPPGPNNADYKRVSVNITRQIQKEFKDIFMGKGCFEGTFSLQVKPDSKPYQAPPDVLHMNYKNCLRKN